MPPRVVLESKPRDGIASLAKTLWPREMVGLLAGNHSRECFTVTGFAPLRNVAIEGDRFAVEPAAFASAIAELEATGSTFLGFVHSHPGGEPKLSLIDRRELWRGCLQLVVGVDGAGRSEFACFRLEGDDVREIPLGDPPVGPAIT